MGANDDGDGYKEVLKKACYSAATTLLPTVLLVSCSHVQCNNTDMWSSITQITKEGNYEHNKTVTVTAFCVSFVRYM